MKSFNPFEHVLIREDVGTEVKNARFIGSDGERFAFEKLNHRMKSPKTGSGIVFMSEQEVEQKIVRL